MLCKLPDDQTSATYLANVAKNIQKIEKRVKVLGYPEDAMREAYTNLVEEGQRSEQELNLLLTLRGVIKPQNDFQQKLTSFINSL